MRWRHCKDLELTAAFGPQHGLRGDKQDNMMESPDFTDPVHGIPVFSLYGEVRRPTAAMMDTFDVLLVDLQDLGCRIYTFITTLRYVLEAAATTRQIGVGSGSTESGRPADRRSEPARGLGKLRRRRPMPMRHGLTLGELGAMVRRDACSSMSTTKSITMREWQPALGTGLWLAARASAPG